MNIGKNETPTSFGGEHNVCIGLFFRNEERFLKKAISSLLSQTFTKFHLILLDDASTDGSTKIAHEFALSDKRVTLLRNSSREGYSASYRKTFKARKNNCKFFAWASGHDFHSPDWLETLVYVLEHDQSIVVAYAKNDRIDEKDHYIRDENQSFSALQEGSFSRLWHIFRFGTGFGNIIYGLFRAEQLEACGVYRKLLVADAVLIWELSITGKIYQSDEILWHRRHDLFQTTDRKSVKKMVVRQRQNMFSNPLFYTYLPWPLVNGLFIMASRMTFGKFKVKEKFHRIICGILFIIRNARWL